MASRQDEVNFTGAFKYLCRDLNGRRVQSYECALALANSQRGGRHCSSHLLPCCDIVILRSTIDVSRLFQKHGLSEYEVFVLLLTWQHCNTAAIYHSHSSGRPRAHLQSNTLCSLRNKQKSNTTVFNEWQSTMLYVSFRKESSAGGSYKFRFANSRAGSGSPKTIKNFCM